jgi:hypothetical protein
LSSFFGISRFSINLDLMTVLSAVSAATYSIWPQRGEHDRLCELFEAKGLDWPHIDHIISVMIVEQLLSIVVAFGLALAWIIILVRLRTA